VDSLWISCEPTGVKAAVLKPFYEDRFNGSSQFVFWLLVPQVKPPVRKPITYLADMAIRLGLRDLRGANLLS
jgi:hypothetical protein